MVALPFIRSASCTRSLSAREFFGDAETSDTTHGEKARAERRRKSNQANFWWHHRTRYIDASPHWFPGNSKANSAFVSNIYRLEPWDFRALLRSHHETHFNQGTPEYEQRKKNGEGHCESDAIKQDWWRHTHCWVTTHTRHYTARLSDNCKGKANVLDVPQETGQGFSSPLLLVSHLSLPVASVGASTTYQLHTIDPNLYLKL